MPSRAVVFLGDLGGEVSSRLSFMRSSYDLSTVVPESTIITYGGEFCSYDDLIQFGKDDGSPSLSKNNASPL